MSYSVDAVTSTMLTEEKAMLETTRTIIDQRLQTLSYQSAEMSSEYMIQAQKHLGTGEDDDNTQIDGVDTFNWEEFKNEFTVAQTKLEAQEKVLEMEKTNMDTKIEEVSTMLESVDKQLEKNAEADFKGLSK